MADIQSSDQTRQDHGGNSKTSTGKPRSKRMSTRIDLTPMVDLGFLLITFFMLTTVLSKPNVMPLVMPKDEGKPTPVNSAKGLTLILGSNDKVYWYEGSDKDKIDSTDYSPNGLRRVILQKKDRVEARFGLEKFTNTKSGELQEGSYLNVIIQPAKDSRYKNLVDALDEMAICQVRYYCILEATKALAQRD